MCQWTATNSGISFQQTKVPWILLILLKLESTILGGGGVIPWRTVAPPGFIPVGTVVQESQALPTPTLGHLAIDLDLQYKHQNDRINVGSTQHRTHKRKSIATRYCPLFSNHLLCGLTECFPETFWKTLHPCYILSACSFNCHFD